MRKACLKARLLTVLVLWTSLDAGAQSVGTGEDPCRRSLEAASRRAEEQSRALDTKLGQLGTTIKSARNCNQELTDGLNRAIPSFGGLGDSLISSLGASLLNKAANQACNLIQQTVGEASGRVNSQLGQLPQVPSFTPPNLQTPGFSPPAPQQQLPSQPESTWQRLSRGIF